MPTQHNQLAISKLLSLYNSVFIPISKSHNDFDVIIENANVLETIAILPAYQTKQKLSNNTIPICKLTKKDNSLRDILIVNKICIVDLSTQKVWLIPHIDIADMKAISVHKRYDSYLLIDEMPLVSNTISDYSQRAQEMAQHM